MLCTKKTKHAILFIVVVIVVISGILALQKPAQTIPETRQLMLNEQDLQQLGLVGGNCQSEEQSSIYSSMVQYSVCYYNVSSLNDTDVVIEFKKYINFDDLNGSYQYDSLHLYSIEGLISENDFGDQSRFRVNNVNDYGGEFNEPGVYYYHLWFTKDLYLVHITSGGVDVDARGYIERIGRQILSKF